MALYQYKAIDQKGSKQNGSLEAANEKEARNKLRSRGLMVTSLDVKLRTSSRINLTGDNLLAFTLQLSQLVNAGVPLYESLLTIEEQYRQEGFHRVLVGLCDKIKRGASLSEAMGAYPESFDKLYRTMVAAGEAAGALGLILNSVHVLLQRQQKIRSEITTAMIYPSILAVFSLVVICAMLGFVVPTLEGIFSERTLNGFTSFVLGVSSFMRNQWHLYVPAIVAVVAISYYQLRSERGKKWLEKMSLKTPLIRHLVITTSIARFTRTMATLQTGGVTLIDSLRMAGDVMKNHLLEEEMKNAEKRIIEGSSLSRELKKSAYIPPLVSRMLAVGEDTGNMTVMFEKVADMYEEDLERSITRLLALLQPCILLFMGLVIGMVMVAIMIPLTDISSLGM
jgi:general secretion pathway protein F